MNVPQEIPQKNIDMVLKLPAWANKLIDLIMKQGFTVIILVAFALYQYDLSNKFFAKFETAQQQTIEKIEQCSKDKEEMQAAYINRLEELIEGIK